MAQVICANVLLAVSSIENGDDESLVKITVGEGQFWEPRMSAASYHLHENSFGIDALYLEGQRRVLYDVNCEMSKEACEGAPGSLCDVVLSDAANVHDDRRALSFEDSFDGDVRRRLVHAPNPWGAGRLEHKTSQQCEDAGCGAPGVYNSDCSLDVFTRVWDAGASPHCAGDNVHGLWVSTGPTVCGCPLESRLSASCLSHLTPRHVVNWE